MKNPADLPEARGARGRGAPAGRARPAGKRPRPGGGVVAPGHELGELRLARAGRLVSGLPRAGRLGRRPRVGAGARVCRSGGGAAGRVCCYSAVNFENLRLCWAGEGELPTCLFASNLARGRSPGTRACGKVVGFEKQMSWLGARRMNGGCFSGRDRCTRTSFHRGSSKPI